ncbi:MAG: thioredoxin [Sandaracinaceae bacterium]|nr:thioredoxin [Sandaracinaceae bacterium]
MVSKKLSQVNDLNFDSEVMQSNVPVLVDFTGKYCGPCKQIEPFIEQLASEYAGRVKIVQVDVEEGPNAAAKAGVKNIPTLVMYKAGEAVATQKGAAPKTILKQLIERGL